MNRMMKLMMVIGLATVLASAASAQGTSTDAFAAVNLPSFADRLEMVSRGLEAMPAGPAKEEAVQMRSYLQGWMEQAERLTGVQREKAQDFQLNCLMMFIRSALTDLEGRLAR